MAGFRAYCDFKNFGGAQNIGAGDSILLDADESRHLCGALRACTGDTVDVFDLSRNVFRCEIKSPSPKRAELGVLQKIDVVESSTKIFVAQCLPKGQAFEEILRQSVEIGASGIYPIVSRRSVVKIDANETAKKMRKWTAKCVEAVKQSANLAQFEIFEPVDFSDFLKNVKNFDSKIVASLEENSKPILKALSERFPEGAKNVCILIGPEGDLASEEYEAAELEGFIPVKLGENVMKSETAALCALSITRAFFVD